MSYLQTVNLKVCKWVVWGAHGSSVAETEFKPSSAASRVHSYCRLLNSFKIKKRLLNKPKVSRGKSVKFAVNNEARQEVLNLTKGGMASKILKQASLEKPSDAANPCVLLWNQVSLRGPRAQKSSALCKVINSLCLCAEGLFFFFFPRAFPFLICINHTSLFSKFWCFDS